MTLQHSIRAQAQTFPSNWIKSQLKMSRTKKDMPVSIGLYNILLYIYIYIYIYMCVCVCVCQF
jgi:hypothetical protein